MNTKPARRDASRVRFQDERDDLDRLEAGRDAVYGASGARQDASSSSVTIVARPDVALDTSTPLPTHYTRSPVIASPRPAPGQSPNPMSSNPVQSPRPTQRPKPILRPSVHFVPRVVSAPDIPAPSRAQVVHLPEHVKPDTPPQAYLRTTRVPATPALYASPAAPPGLDRPRERAEHWSEVPLGTDKPYAHIEGGGSLDGRPAAAAMATPHPGRQRRQVLPNDQYNALGLPHNYEDENSGANPEKEQPGTLTSLVALYGLRGRDQAPKLQRGDTSSTYWPTFNSLMPSRSASVHSVHSDDVVDEDDPRVTGKQPNRIDEDKKAKELGVASCDSGDGCDEKAASKAKTEAAEQKQLFILRLASALMRYGTPSHRIESQLAAAARILEVDAQFVHLPSIIIASFNESDSSCSATHFVKASQGLALGKLHRVHAIYRKVMHHEIGAEQGAKELEDVLRSPPIFGLAARCGLGFLIAAMIAPLAFGGSFVDALVSGTAGAILCWLQLHVAARNALYANVFEISVAIGIAFVARGLSTIQSQIFCYSAISSSGVVMILPGWLVLCSSLELASKNIICGSVRMIYAIIYSLFLGFGLTIGSDLWFLVDSGARAARVAATADRDGITVEGTFQPNNATVAPFAGAFTFNNGTAFDLPNIVEACYRDPTWPWYLRTFPWWTNFILVPTFSLVSSLSNLQPLVSKHMLVMVIISCASFAANTIANRYIFNRSDVVSAIGAFVVGILGNLYSRIFGGTAFTSMVTGVLFLVPSGLAAAGGLAQNYRGQDGDQYSNGLEIGLRMVQVGIGITVGLFGSGLLVYSFGRRKSGATFAF